MYLYMGENLYL